MSAVENEGAVVNVQEPAESPLVEESPGWAVRSRAAMETLDAFEPEEQHGKPAAENTPASRPRPLSPPLTLVSSAAPPVSLSELKAAGIECDEREAAAIVRALCGTLESAELLRRLQANVGSSPVSKLTDGSVYIDLASRTGVTTDATFENSAAALQSVGRTLYGLLPPLSKVKLGAAIVARTSGSPGDFGSLTEMSSLLARYEKGNGKELIAGVYRRWRPGTRLNESVHEPLRESERPSHQPELQTAARVRASYRPATVVKAALVATVMISVGVWFFLSRAQATAATDLALLPHTNEIAARALSFAPSRSTASGPRTNRSRAAAPAAQSARSGIEPGARWRNDGTIAPPVAPLIAARALDPVITLPSPASVTSMSVSDATSNVDSMASAPTAAPAAAAPPPLVTYDASAPEVTPPVPVLPRLLGGLRPTSPGVRLDALKIAVVVNGDGTIESVSGVTRPENMGEYVLLTAALSAVKGWQFTPATKDGVPVRYRLVVPLRHVTSSTP